MIRFVRLGLIAAFLTLFVALVPAVAQAYGGYGSSYTPSYSSPTYTPSYGGYSSTYSSSYGSSYSMPSLGYSAPSLGYSTPSLGSYSTPSYSSPSYGRSYFDYGSNGSYYGQLNGAGFPKTQYVRPYVRRDGTFVQGYWRNSPRDGLSTCRIIRC